MRLIVLHGLVQHLHLGGGHIGGIGYDHVVTAQKFRRLLPGVQLDAADPAGEMVVLNVLLRHADGLGRDLPQGNPDIPDPGGNGQSHAAAAGAQIQDPRVLGQQHGLVDGQIRQSFRVVPGDQHIRRHRQGEAVKLPFPQDVRQGLPLEMAAGQFLDLVYVPAEHHQRKIRHQLGDAPVRGGGDDLPRGELRVLPIHLPERIPGGPKQIVIGPFLVHAHQLSAPSCSGITACMAAMAHSIMLSSGSLVVNRWNHIPGADRIRVRTLSWRPTRRLNS